MQNAKAFCILHCIDKLSTSPRCSPSPAAISFGVATLPARTSRTSSGSSASLAKRAINWLGFQLDGSGQSDPPVELPATAAAFQANQPILHRYRHPASEQKPSNNDATATIAANVVLSAGDCQMCRKALSTFSSNAE